MPDITADKLAQRILENHLLDARTTERSMAKAGGRSATLDDFTSVLIQQELLTNWQISRLMEGQRQGYFYGNWKVLYLVGAGTFARVYRGYHTKTSDIKAIKVLRHRYSEDAEKLDSFLREGKTVMKLRHPNIVPIYEAEEERGRSYMVMDFVEGQNLRDYVRAHTKLKVKTALNITRDLAAGLDYAFEFGICHRDMKLSNVLLSTKGQAKLVDFGLAAVQTDDADTENSTNARSIDYAGLEKATKVERDDKRSDTYFLGCMLYHMVTGVSPLSETKDRSVRISPHRFYEVPPVTSHEPNLPHRLVVLIYKLMELDPMKRPQTPGLALKEIDRVIDALEAGKVEKYDANIAEQSAEEYAKQQKEEKEGDGKTLMLIESNTKIQNLLREKLKAHGYRVLIISNPQRAIQRFDGLVAGDDAPADVVIFGSSGLGRVAIEAFDYFQKADFGYIPAIVLVKPALKPLLKHVTKKDTGVVLPLPLKFKQLRSSLQKLLKLETSNES